MVGAGMGWSCECVRACVYARVSVSASACVGAYVMLIMQGTLCKGPLCMERSGALLPVTIMCKVLGFWKSCMCMSHVPWVVCHISQTHSCSVQAHTLYKPLAPGVAGFLFLIGSPPLYAQGSLWQTLWAEAHPRPAAKQKPLLDAEREGERVLDWLETLPPETLWQELQAVALSSSIALLARCSGVLLPDAAARLSE